MKEILKQIYERILGAPVTSMIAMLVVIFVLLNINNIDINTLTVLIGAAASLCGAKDK